MSWSTGANCLKCCYIISTFWILIGYELCTDSTLRGQGRHANECERPTGVRVVFRHRGVLNPDGIFVRHEFAAGARRIDLGELGAEKQYL